VAFAEGAVTEAAGHDGVISSIVDKLGADPCLLAIVVIVALAFWFVLRALGRITKMENQRVAQWTKAMKGDTDGSN